MSDTWSDFIEDNPDRVACDPAARPLTVGDVPRPTRRSGRLRPVDLVAEAHASEEAAQAAVIDWSKNRRVRARMPEVALLFHVPNGGARHGAVGAKLKATGVKRGVPDLLLPVPRTRARGDTLRDMWTGLAIELKRGTNDVEKGDSQYRWLRRLQRQGWATDVAHSARQTIALIEEYLLDPEHFIPGH